MRSEADSLAAIAAALVKTLSTTEESAVRIAQARLAGVVAGLWRCYGELAEVVGMLPSHTPAEVALPERWEAFSPGDTVRIAGSMAATDTRIALRNQLTTQQLEEVIEQLTETVLHAPILARRELLLLLRELDPALVESLASLIHSRDQDTDVIDPRHRTF